MDTTEILATIIGTLALGLAIYYFFFEKENSENTEAGRTGMILHFKEGLKIFRFELYRGISIIYISAHKDATQDPAKEYYQYQYWWNGEIQYGNSNHLEELRQKAVDEIDNFLQK